MKRITIFGIHLSYWTIYFLFTAIFFVVLRGHDPSKEVILDLKALFYGCNVTASILGFYSFHYLLFKQIYKNNKIFKLLLVGLGLILVIGLISSSIIVILTQKLR